MPSGKDRARDNIWWIEHRLVIPDGPLIGQRFILRPWQKKILRGIYETETRRAIISVGRKNGKTALAAALLLLHLCGYEARRNSELFSSAMSRDQAAVLFRLAAKMVRLSPELRNRVVVRDTVKQLYFPPLGTLYTALSSDAATNFGLSPVFICHDELGQVKGPRHTLYEALETATGAQEDPLSVVISTQAPADADLLSVLIDDALQEHDVKTKVFMFSAPQNIADPFSQKAIKLANPAFTEFQNKKEVMDMAHAAKRMPSREAEYRNLILNQRVEASNPFITQAVWDKNQDEPHKLGVTYGGLDLATVSDLCAFVMVSPLGHYIDVEATFWLPGEGLKEKALHDRVPYDLWHEQGFLKTTPGFSVEYEFVARYLVDMIEKRDLRRIAFDKWNMKHLKPWLLKAGLTQAMMDSIFVEFGQGWYSMSPALNTLETYLREGRMRIGGNPVMRMCSRNAVVKMDEAGNRKLDKRHSRGRIDGMVALAMATSVAVEKSQEKHVYGAVPIDRILEAV